MSVRNALFPAFLVCAFASLSVSGQDKPEAKPATEVEIRQLVKDLGDLHFEVRQNASDRLTAIGLAALPELQAATKGRDPEVCLRAWRIINQWAGEGKVPALLFQLADQSAPIRAAAADSLGKLGAAARTAVPALNDAAKDKSEIVRCCAREALKVIESCPEVRLEVIDLDGPLTVGGECRYKIEVSNTGTASATTVRIIIQLPDEISVTNVEGPSFRRHEQRIVSVPQTIDPNAKLRWELHGRAAKKGEAQFTVEVMADQLPAPLRETKKTAIHAPAKDLE